MELIQHEIRATLRNSFVFLNQWLIYMFTPTTPLACHLHLLGLQSEYHFIFQVLRLHWMVSTVFKKNAPQSCQTMRPMCDHYEWWSGFDWQICNTDLCGQTWLTPTLDKFGWWISAGFERYTCHSVTFQNSLDNSSIARPKECSGNSICNNFWSDSNTYSDDTQRFRHGELSSTIISQSFHAQSRYKKAVSHLQSRLLFILAIDFWGSDLSEWLWSIMIG